MQRSSDKDADAKKYFYPKCLNRRITEDQRKSLEKMPKENFGEWDVKNGNQSITFQCLKYFIYSTLPLKELMNIF
jgi:hypothetical protein